jgi:hypothetical protein
VRKSGKLDYQIISQTSSTNLCVADEYWKMICLKTHSSILDFVIQCCSTDPAQDVVLHQLESIALIKACSVGVSI